MNTEYDAVAYIAGENEKVVEENESLKKLLLKTKEIIETSSAVQDTVWYDGITTLCDKIEMTLIKYESKEADLA